MVALYVPYVSIGDQVLGFLPGYITEEGIANGHGVFLLELLGSITALPAWSAYAYFLLVLAVLGALGLHFAFIAERPSAPDRRVMQQARQALILASVMLVGLSPHYPWYLAWLAPFACLVPRPSVLWLLAVAPLLAHGSFEYLAVPGIVYGPAIGLAAFELYRGSVARLAVPSPVIRSV